MGNYQLYLFLVYVAEENIQAEFNLQMQQNSD